MRVIIVVKGVEIFLCDNGIKAKFVLVSLKNVSLMALESSFVLAFIPHFDGHYDYWSMMIENFLWSKEYWSIVESYKRKNFDECPKISFGDCFTMDGKRICCHFQEVACEISDPSTRVVAFVEMSQNWLFPMKIVSIQSCLMVKVKDPSWSWHFRYAHLNYDGLKILEKKNMVIGLPPIIYSSLVCEKCVVTNNISLNFPK
ncbi:hypothetical protein J1N35_014942, partial [Gossypium stocksii]